MSGFSRFASAFGLAPKAAPVVAEDPKKDETKEERDARRAKERARKADESDEDYAKRCAELDDKEKAEDENREQEEKDKGKKTGEKDEEEKCRIARSEGVKAERARWAATLSDPRAKNRGVYACQMLDTTDMSSEHVLGMVATFPEQANVGATEAEGLAQRMEAVRTANPAPTPSSAAGGPAVGTPEHTASLIANAAAVARGEKPAK